MRQTSIGDRLFVVLFGITILLIGGGIAYDPIKQQGLGSGRAFRFPASSVGVVASLLLLLRNQEASGSPAGEFDDEL